MDAPGLDACLLHENDSDKDAYLFPSAQVDESNDSREDLMALSVDVPNNDQMSQSSHQKRSHCIKWTARGLLISVPSSSAWVLVLRKSKEGST